MALESKIRSMSLTTLAMACLAIATADGAEAATYTETISDNPSTFICSTGDDLKTCYGYIFMFPPSPTGTGTLISGSGAFYAKTGDTVDIDLRYSSPLYVPKGTGIGPATSDNHPYDVAFALLYEWNGSQFNISTGPSSSVSSIIGYVGPSDLTSSDKNHRYIGGFVGFGGSFLTPVAPFSITGLDSTITVLTGDANPVYEVAYGYQITVPEPASWAVLLVGLSIVGAALRTRRRHQPLMVAGRTTRHVT
ncbi:MAG TPA: PEPxxWA-CTERM sorting domain-containing protein [Caulobacteraceae bacterium]|jgi:hypothetical protein